MHAAVRLSEQLKRMGKNMPSVSIDEGGATWNRQITQQELSQALVRLNYSIGSTGGHAEKIVNDVIKHRELTITNQKPGSKTDTITRAELTATLVRMMVKDSYGYLKFKGAYGNADSLSRDILIDVTEHREHLIEGAYYKASDGILWHRRDGRFIKFGDVMRYSDDVPRRPLKQLHDDI